MTTPDMNKYPLPEGYEWYNDNYSSYAEERFGVLDNKDKNKYFVWANRLKGETKLIVRQSHLRGPSKVLEECDTAEEARAYISAYMLLGMHNGNT